MSKFLRIKDVCEMTKIAKSTVWLWVKQDKLWVKQDRFPQPKKISARVTIWNEDEIKKWMTEKLK